MLEDSTSQMTGISANLSIAPSRDHLAGKVPRCDTSWSDKRLARARVETKVTKRPRWTTLPC